jgi:hypothetical protein
MTLDTLSGSTSIHGGDSSGRRILFVTPGASHIAVRHVQRKAGVVMAEAGYLPGGGDVASGAVLIARRGLELALVRVGLWQVSHASLVWCGSVWQPAQFREAKW